MNKSEYTKALFESAAAVRAATSEMTALSTSLKVDEAQARLAGNLAPEERTAAVAELGVSQATLAAQFVKVMAAKDALYELAMAGFEA